MYLTQSKNAIPLAFIGKEERGRLGPILGHISGPSPPIA
jgi:hypothetical protein